MPSAAAILNAAILEADRPYREAVACEIEGRQGCWEIVADILTKAYVLSWLSGAESVWSSARLTGAEVAQFDRGVTVAFEPGPFMEAVAGFEGRIPLTRWELEFLLVKAELTAKAVVQAERLGAAEAAIQRSGLAGVFYISDVDKSTIINVRQILAEVIRGDPTEMDLPTFISRAQAAGARNLTAARLETVYRNNLTGAFCEAQAASLDRAGGAFPLSMLVEVRDKRTRGNPNGKYANKGKHWQMDGLVLPIGMMRELGVIPPNGHNCRGSIRGVSAAEAYRNGWIDLDGNIDHGALSVHNAGRLAIVSSGEYPDPGFR